MNNKALVLENGFEINIPKQLIIYLNDNKINWELYDMRQKFWPENQEETFKFFAGLSQGQELYCHTAFDGYKQLELMIQLLHKLKDKNFTFKIMHGCFCNDILNFLAENESSITPKELEEELENDELSDKEYDEIYERIHTFKKEINKKFEEVLVAHNIFWLKSFGDEIPLRSIDDLNANKYNL